MAFQTLLLLERGGPLAPGEIARHVKRKLSTVSNPRVKLRVADLVRHDTEGGRPRYWLKHPKETRAVLAGLMRFVRSTAHLRGKR